MAQVYFHCFTSRGMLVDRRGASFDDLIEAREGAAAVVRFKIVRNGDAPLTQT